MSEQTFFSGLDDEPIQLTLTQNIEMHIDDRKGSIQIGAVTSISADNDVTRQLDISVMNCVY